MKKTVLFMLYLVLLQPSAFAGTTTLHSPIANRFFIADSWIAGFTYGLCSSKERRLSNAWKRANRTAANDAKIWGGLFISDPSRKFSGRLWETVSRVTWQLPQTAIGLSYAHFENTIGGNVDTVHYFHGATVLTGRHTLFFNLGGPAVTLGSYLTGSSGMHATVDNYILQHEYGHYLQSCAMGIAWFGRIAIPNIRSQHGEYKKLYLSHDFHPTEQDANRRAFLYFNTKLPGFKNDRAYTNDFSTANEGWDFRRNPLFQCGIPVKAGNSFFYYVDFDNAEQVHSLEKLRVRAQWYDYVFPVVSGLYNAYWYNHVRKEKIR